MPSSLTAIVGSVHQSREADPATQTIPLKNISLARTAAENLGRNQQARVRINRILLLRTLLDGELFVNKN